MASRKLRVTPVRVRPLWRAAACAVLLAVGLAAPHLAGHDEVRRAAAGGPAVAAVALDGAGARPAPCLLCLAGIQVRDAHWRVAAAPLPAAGVELPLAPLGPELAPREDRREPAAPRAPPLG